MAKRGFRCSPQQRRIWRSGPNMAVATCAVVWRGPIEPQRLSEALASVAQRHEILRTRFQCLPETTVPLQFPDSQSPQLEVCDWRSLDAATRALRLADALEQPELDLSDTQPWPVRLIRLTHDEALLHFHVPGLCGDGRGILNLLRELALTYATGQAPGDPPLQYIDAAEVLNDLLESAESRPDRDFWANAELAGGEARDLPFTRQAPTSRQGYGRIDLTGDLPDWSGLDEDAITVRLMAGWAELLCRLTGRDWVTPGWIYHGRSFDELREAIGPFAKALPLAITPNRFPSHQALCDWITETLAGQAEFGDFFDDDRDDLNFEFLCESIRVSPIPIANEGSVAIRRLSVHGEPFKLKLAALHGAPNDLRLSLYFDHSFLEEDAARLMADQLTALLNHAEVDARLPSRKLRAMGQAEWRARVVDYNRTASAISESRVHRLIADRARQNPDATALVFGEGAMTFGDLNRRAGRLARQLRDCGVGPETVVPVCGDRSPALIVGILATLKAGGAFLPLDPGYPSQRLRFMLDDSGARLLLRGKGAPPLDDFSGEVLDLEELTASPSDGVDPANAEPAVSIAPTNTAYLIYTSGSTGTPKAVAITHGSLSNYLAWGMDRYIGTSGDGQGTLLFTSIGFDLTITSLFLPLAAGKPIYIVDEVRATGVRATGVRATGVRATGGEALSVLQGVAAALNRDQRFDFLKLTPAHLEALRTMIGSERLASSVATLILGGEALSYPTVRAIQKSGLPVAINEYGPTEATVGCANYQVSAPGNREPGHGSVPIGQPIGNAAMFLLDEDLQPVASGVAGQIFIGGTGLARGYWHRPDATAERFIPNPFADTAGERLYRSGDLARFNRDGDLVFLSRLDHQVKLRGYRIELGEIEAVLRDYADVRDAVVLLRQDAARGEELAAYIVSAAAIDPGGMAEFARARLPEPMVPALFVQVDAIPLTTNGKVDRQTLALLDGTASGDGESGHPPQTALEGTLCAMWSHVLGKNCRDREASFFAMGGHSLLLIKLHTRLQNLFGFDIPIGLLFDAPSLAAMASAIASQSPAAERTAHTASLFMKVSTMDPAEKERLALAHDLAETAAENGPERDAALVRCLDSGAAPRPDHGIGPRPQGEDAPLSYAQQRLWGFEQMEPGTPTYNNPWANRLLGPLDRNAMGRAFTELERRHAILRTYYPMVDGLPVQRMGPPRAEVLLIRDLASEISDEAARDAAAERLIAEEAARPINVNQGPVWRATLLILSADVHVLMLTMHHICTDGWSMRLLVAEFAVLYRHFQTAKIADSGEQPLPLPEPRLQYADYAYWQRHHLDEAAMDEGLAFWRKQLAGSSFQPYLPTDLPRPAQRRYQGAMHRIRLAPQVSQTLREISRDRGVTLFTTLLTGFFILLHHRARRGDVIVGADLANRNRAETETMIGFFVNQLILRTNLGGRPSLAELISRVHADSRTAFAYSEIPFDRIVKAVQPQPSLSHAPVFQVKLFLEHVGEATAFEGLTVANLNAESQVARYDLTLGLWDGPEGIHGWFNYDRGLFLAATIANLAEDWLTILDALAAEGELGLDRLCERLDEAERERTAAANTQLLADSFKTFRKGRRATKVSLSADPVKKISGERLYRIEPAMEKVDLGDWARAHRDDLERELDRHGVILFRGFQIDEPAVFEHFINAVIGEVFKENKEHQPITANGVVQVPVDYAADQHLLWHNENSFNLAWPSKIAFACALPAISGGETSVVDSREVFHRIEPAVRERFLELGVMYVRNYSPGVGLNWRQVFGTEDRAVVEAKCRAEAMSFEWFGDRLRTTAVRPAALQHPRTGEWCWFNQAQHWHFSCLDPDTQAAIEALYCERDYPRQCYLGDGTPIADETMRSILNIYRELERSEPWRQGDVMLLDNLLTAHGRNPYRGPRRLLVSMGDLMRFDNGVLVS